MIKLHQIYKCSICGNIIEVINVGGGELVCCGKAMNLMEENTIEASHEKHVPIIEESDNFVKVVVGSDLHPMEDKHYIEWIEIETESNKFLKKFLKPGEKPEASFEINEKVINARAYCNLHGLWKS